MTAGGLLPCDWIIHAVGPRYDERYLVASEHALFSAYKSSLVHATEKQIKRIIFRYSRSLFSVIHTSKLLLVSNKLIRTDCLLVVFTNQRRNIRDLMELM